MMIYFLTNVKFLHNDIIIFQTQKLILRLEKLVTDVSNLAGPLDSSLSVSVDFHCSTDRRFYPSGHF
jgi:hypothetical protein